MLKHIVRLPVVLGSLLLLCSSAAAAVTVSSLYDAEVMVEGQSASQRNEAIRRAFTRVLVKVTGHRDVPARAELAPEIAQASRYVQQYRYKLIEVDDDQIKDQVPGAKASGNAAEEGSAPDSVPEPARLLHVIFDRVAIDRMLKNAALPVWGENRPGCLVWIGSEAGGRRVLVNLESTESEIGASLRHSADNRGIPLLFPLLDLEDQANLSSADLWGDFDSNIRHASSRYTPDLLLTGKLTRLANSNWRASWRLYHGDQITQWQDRSSGQAALAEAAMEQLADLLAERFAPLGADFSLNRVRVRVDGLTRFSDYSRVSRFLESQSSVDLVEVVSADPDAMVYDLQTRGGVQVLRQGLELGGVLISEENGGVTDQINDSGIDLYYRLR